LELFFIAEIVVILLLVLVFMLFWLSRPRKSVSLLRLRDHRGVNLSVKKETDLGITCNKKDKVNYHFIKVGQSFVFHEFLSNVTRFFGIEGTVYVPVIDGGQSVHEALSNYLQFLWGREFYEALPAEQKRKIENDKVGITIEVPRPIKNTLKDSEGKELPPFAATDVNDELDSEALRNLFYDEDEAKKSLTSTIYNAIIWFALGALLVYSLIRSGYLGG